MNRKEFLQRSLSYGAGCCALAGLNTTLAADAPSDQATQALQQEKQFIENWVTDLMDTLENVLDEPTRVKILAGCGQGCHRRHKFTQDIVEAGKGDVDKLIEAYKRSFGIERKGDEVHIFYGRGPKGCWCPAAQNRPAKAKDLHCECTRGKHQHMWETALGRPIKVEIVESIRRGSERCHFLVRLA